jgi:hypothetical protein
MATVLGLGYGLTTDDALRAYRESHLDQLPTSNRWKPFLTDHAAGLHDGRADRFHRVCLVCRIGRSETAASAPRRS